MGSGPAVNLTDTVIIRRTFAAGSDLDVDSLSQSQIFDMADTDSGGKQVKLVCSKEAFMNIELLIPHEVGLRL